MEKNILPLADRFAAALPANLTEDEVNALASKELGGEFEVDHISITILPKGDNEDTGPEEVAAAERILAWVQGPGAPYFRALTDFEDDFEDPTIDTSAYVHVDENAVSLDLLPTTDSGHSLIPHIVMEMIGENSWFTVERIGTLDGEEHITSFDSRDRDEQEEPPEDADGDLELDEMLEQLLADRDAEHAVDDLARLAFRPEEHIDFEALMSLLPVFDISAERITFSQDLKAYTFEAYSKKDVVMLVLAMAEVCDGHRMLQTIDTADNYTGDPYHQTPGRFERLSALLLSKYDGSQRAIEIIEEFCYSDKGE